MDGIKAAGLRLLSGDVNLTPAELRQAMDEIKVAMELVKDQGLEPDQTAYVVDKLQTLLELATVLHAKTLN